MIRSVALFSILLTIAFSAAAADEFAFCTACHGAHGNGNDAIRAPKIAGMEPWYIRRQLASFRSNWRGAHADDNAGNEMRPIGVRVSNEADVERALAYVAMFTAKSPRPTLEGNIDNGRRLFATCATCHGPQAQGNEALGAPALASRNDWYLLTQLKNFMRGIRGSAPEDVYGTQMRAAVAALTSERDMQDVVAFINTLR